MSFDEQDFSTMRRCHVEDTPCRTCRYAYRGGIGQATCRIFDDAENNVKPDGVYFDNAPCPQYAAGEDLLPFEILL